MLNKAIKTAVALAVAGLALSGCKPTTPTVAKIEPPVDKTTNAYACSGEESLATVKRLIRQEAHKYAGGKAGDLDDPSIDDLMEISLVTISGAEPEIKKVTCEAQFGIRVPEGAREALADKNLIGNYLRQGFSGAMAIPEVPTELARGDGSTISITYSRQRSADDQDYIFTVNDVGPMALALLRASSAVSATSHKTAPGVIGPSAAISAGQFHRSSPALADLTLTRTSTGWHIVITGGAPDQDGSAPADCTIEADGGLADGKIQAKLTEEYQGGGHGQVTITTSGDDLTVTDADVSSCGVGSDLDGKYIRDAKTGG